MNLNDHIDSFLIDQQGTVIADLIGEAYQSISRRRPSQTLDEPQPLSLPKTILSQVSSVETEAWTVLHHGESDTTTYMVRKLPGFELWQLVVRTAQSSRDGQITRYGSTAFTTAIHDLKNPLGAIYSYADALLDPDMGFELPAPGKSIIEKIQKAAIRTLDMLKNYESLFFMQRESSPRSTEVHQSLRTIIETSTHLLAPDVNLEVAVLDEEVFVPLSDFSLERIISNLLVNAFKYTESGGTISVNTRVLDGNVHIYIANSGPLIAEEDKEEIFAFRRRGKTSGEQSGTGLGLYIARKLVQGANGSLQLTIDADRGNVFEVILPRM